VARVERLSRQPLSAEFKGRQMGGIINTLNKKIYIFSTLNMFLIIKKSKVTLIKNSDFFSSP
jgi:hypothetical protein